MTEGICEQCGTDGEMEEGVGKLDDIYDEQDLDPTGGFDYIEGPSNDVDTFEKMHKNLYKEDEYEDTDNEDDGFEDIQAGEEMEEQGYTGGGNAPDMDLSNIDSAYDFISGGPMAGGDVYPTEEEMDEQCLDCVDEYETMESAWNEEEIDEVDISGSQGVYGDMDPAYDFDSEGPGKAGPYQRSSYNEDEMGEQRIKRRDDDFEEDELEVDFDTFDPRDKSWEEIKAHTGNWDEIDEDLQESFVNQKNKIMEMMNRMKVIK
jgi:hypothetical protein